MPVPAVEGLTAFEEIGRGGFGVVYRARQESLGRDIAVKVLPGVHQDSESFARFERECKALGSVGAHPNIATVYGCGVTTDGEGFLAMELLDGGSLADRIAAGPLPWEEVARIGVALSGALESAHRLGVLHRDVKPQNVLFDRLGTPKLLDFGIASVPGAYQTRTSAVSLTLAHAAPEITAGGRATVASDVYALGSTLWTATAGKAPFVREGEDTLVPLLARIAASPVPDLPGVSPVLSALLAKSMAKDPAGRPASAEELGTGLAYVLRSAGETVDGPAVLTPSTRGGAFAAAAPVADASEQTLARAALVGAALALPADPEDKPDGRRRRILAGLAACLLLFAVGVLAIIGLFHPGSGGQADAASLSLGTSSAPGRSTPHSSAAPPAHSSSLGHSSTGSPSAHSGSPASPGGASKAGPVSLFAPPPTAVHTAPSILSASSSSPSSASSHPTTSPTPTSTASSSPTTSPSPTPTPAPGTPGEGTSRASSWSAKTVGVEVRWLAPASGGPVSTYDVRRTRMQGSAVLSSPVIVATGQRTVGRDVIVDAPVTKDSRGWFRWEVRSRGPGGVSGWRVLSVHLTDLRGHHCSPAVQEMRSTGLMTRATRQSSSGTLVVTAQSVAAGDRRPGKALVLTCTVS